MKKSLNRILDDAVQMSLDNPGKTCYVLNVFGGSGHGPFIDRTLVKRKLLRGKYSLYATVLDGQITDGCNVRF